MQVRYDATTGTNSLKQVRISAANAAQRAGRAGRVQKGVCYHLFMARETLQRNQQPEVQRSPLEPLCLQIKALKLGSLRTTLNGLMSAPDTNAANHAVSFLAGLRLIVQKTQTKKQAAKETAASSSSDGGGGSSTGGGSSGQGGSADPLQWEDEELTILGEHLAAMPVPPSIGKMLVLGATFRCLDPILVIAAVLGARSPFSIPLHAREAGNNVKCGFDPTSDSIAVLKAYRAWLRSRSGGGEKQFLRSNFLNKQALLTIERTCKLYRSALEARGLLCSSTPNSGGGGGGGGSDENEHANNMALVKALLGASLFPNIATVASGLPPTPQSGGGGRKPAPAGGAAADIPLTFRTAALFGKKKVRKANGAVNDRAVHVHPSSVLRKFQPQLSAILKARSAREPAPILVYYSRIKTSRDFVCDSTLVNPLALLLFGASELEVDDPAVVSAGAGDDAAAPAALAATRLSIHQWLCFDLSPEQAALVVEFRNTLDRMSHCSAGAQHALVNLVATLVQADGRGDYDTGQPLPAGWMVSDDPSSSTGRLLFTNKHTRKAQYSWPTAPALKSTATAITTATATATATTKATATGSKGNAKAKVVAAQPRRLHATTITATTASNSRHNSNRVGGSGGDSSSSSKGANPAVVDRAGRRSEDTSIASRAAASDAARVIKAIEAQAEAAAATLKAEQENAAAAERSALAAVAKEKAEEEEAKKATLRLAAASQKAEAVSSGGLQHTTVAAFLKKLDLAHYADKFAAAGIDDAALCQIIDDVEDAAADGGGYGDDGSEDDGPNPAEELIIRVGARGGGAVKLRKALVKGGPKAVSGGGGGGGGSLGRGRGRGGGGGRGQGGGKGGGGRGQGGGKGGGGGGGSGRKVKRDAKPAAKGKKKK